MRCPEGLKLQPDPWAWAFLAGMVALGVYGLIVVVRVVQRGSLDLYRDKRLNPTGRAAIAHAGIPVAIGWLGIVLYALSMACGLWG